MNSSCADEVTAATTDQFQFTRYAVLTIANLLSISRSILQIGIPRLEAVKDLGHPANEYQKQGSNPDLAAPKPEPQDCNLHEALNVRPKGDN